MIKLFLGIFTREKVCFDYLLITVAIMGKHFYIFFPLYRDVFFNGGYVLFLGNLHVQYVHVRYQKNQGSLGILNRQEGMHLSLLVPYLLWINLLQSCVQFIFCVLFVFITY